MTCSGMHSYCFSCIKLWVLNKRDLNCPECRKSCDDIIKFPIEKDKLTDDFKKFTESVKIIPAKLKHSENCDCYRKHFENTCMYPDWSIIHYIQNRKQLDYYYKNIGKYEDPKQLIKSINWNLVQLN